MKEILFAVFSFFLLISCSSNEETELPQYIGNYELRSCYDKTKTFPDAQGGCEITSNRGIIKIEMQIDKSAEESISFNGYITGNKVKKNNGELFGEIIDGKSFWIYQTDGTVYEFWHRLYNGDSDTVEGSSGRCIAVTQKGTRCKRKAEKGSLYCWQHKYNH